MRVLAALLLLLLFTQCDSPQKTPEVPKEENTPKFVTAPRFNADSAYAYVKAQVDFGPRVPNSAEHRACGDFLVQKLESFGLEVLVQELEATAFNGTKLSGRNIMAQLNPSAKKRILLAAHWDTRPFADQDNERVNEPILGANDGGSGVGVLLEIARVIQSASKKPNVGVDIMLFDLEDYGNGGTPNSYCLGSQYWSNNKMPEGYKAFYGILLDMVGAQGAKFYREGHSDQFAPSVVNKVWMTAERLGYGATFVNQKVTTIVDDHYYVNTMGSTPMIDIIQYDPTTNGYFGSYWHTHDDDMDIIDKLTLSQVGETVLAVLYNE
ncbi:MAG: M28 family peptidase [Bacteroidota bacterium]